MTAVFKSQVQHVLTIEVDSKRRAIVQLPESHSDFFKIGPLERGYNLLSEKGNLVAVQGERGYLRSIHSA